MGGLTDEGGAENQRICVYFYRLLLARPGPSWPSKHVVILRLIQSAFLLLNHLFIYTKLLGNHFDWSSSKLHGAKIFWILTAIGNCRPLPPLTKIY